MSATQTELSCASSAEIMLVSPDEPGVITGPAEPPVSEKPPVTMAWRPYDIKSSRYRCEVRLVEEPEGGYSAYVPMLPGVVSQGESDDETLRNTREALEAAIEAYGGEIPWVDDYEPIVAGEQERWIVVNG